MRVITRTAFVLVRVSTSSLSQTGSGNAVHDAAEGKLERMPESLEVRFALSALLPHLRDGAKTYVLDPQKGYVVNRNGTNGFSCIMMRKEWSWPQLTFRDDPLRSHLLRRRRIEKDAPSLDRCRKAESSGQVKPSEQK